MWVGFLPILFLLPTNFKQLLDEIFVISGIIKVEVSIICRSLSIRRFWGKGEKWKRKRKKKSPLPQPRRKAWYSGYICRSRRLRLITLTEIILYLQVISQFLAWSMKRIEKPFLLRCPRIWHCCPCTWHCSWKSCTARATYRLFTNPLAIAVK